MIESSKTPPNGEPNATSHTFADAYCQPSGLIGDHWLEMTATISLKRTEDFAEWMDHQLAATEIELAEFASTRSMASDR